jgi:hypothetical protein
MRDRHDPVQVVVVFDNHTRAQLRRLNQHCVDTLDKERRLRG